MAQILKKSDQLNEMMARRHKKIEALLKINEEIARLSGEVAGEIEQEFTIDQALREVAAPSEDKPAWSSPPQIVAEPLWREQRKKKGSASAQASLHNGSASAQINLHNSSASAQASLHNGSQLALAPQMGRGIPAQIRRVAPPTAEEQNVQITDLLSLPAIRVESFDLVVPDGRLYFVAGANHFAMFIGRSLFHGNIGTIYTNEKQPMKIKNCQHHGRDFPTKQSKCTFYHDPLKFDKSDDIRNFVANSWLYNATRPTDDLIAVKYRRFGSFANLDEDIKYIGDDDITKYRDMVFHDLLCSLLLLGKT